MIRAAKLGIALGVTMALAETLNLISPYKPLPKEEHAMTKNEKCQVDLIVWQWVTGKTADTPRDRYNLCKSWEPIQ